MTQAWVLDLEASPAPAAPELLGLWRALPEASGPRDGPAGEGTWCIELPDRSHLAGDRLGECAGALEEAGLALDPAVERLHAVLSECRSGASFAAPTPPGERDRAETELLAWLDGALSTGGEVSFSSGHDGSSRLGSFRHQIGELLSDLARWSAPWSWIETRAGGHTLARTRVAIGGDTTSLWRQGAGLGEVSLHDASVGLVLSSRATLLRGLSLAARGAATASAVLALPGGGLLALPAVWRFFNAVMRERARREPRRG